PALRELLKTPDLRQLDQRISIRYELKPLNPEETAAYVAHRLTIAGGSTSVSFAPRSLELVHKYTGGIPRLINLLCDRALVGGYSARTSRITPQIVTNAATKLELRSPHRVLGLLPKRAAAFLAAAAGMMMLGAIATYSVILLQAHAASARTAEPSPAPQADTVRAPAPTVPPPVQADPAPASPPAVAAAPSGSDPATAEPKATAGTPPVASVDA